MILYGIVQREVAVGPQWIYIATVGYDRLALHQVGWH